jgi:hypothetical protein
MVSVAWQEWSRRCSAIGFAMACGANDCRSCGNGLWVEEWTFCQLRVAAQGSGSGGILGGKRADGLELALVV